MRYLYFIALVVILILSQVYINYPLFIYALLFTSLYKLLQKIGNGIVLREMIAVYSCIIYLLMPLIGYQFYGVDNASSKLWAKYMTVNESVYFGFTFPAITVFIMGMFLPAFSSKYEPDSYNGLLPVIKSAKEALSNNDVWLRLLAIGLFGYFFRVVFSAGILSVFLYIFYLILFTALLCIYFTPQLKYKKLYITMIVLLVLYEAIQSGMFTVLVYMGIVIGSIIFIGKKIAFWKKIAVLVMTVFFIITLQTTKGTFRKKTWGKEYEGSKTELFTDLMQKNLSNYGNFFDKKTFFPLYARMNQGYNTALVLRRIPAVQDFDNGRSIYLTIASALVPRFLWKDKLESGGIYNMKHFAGWTIKGWSTNIGPVGEAYGNFGVLGGVIYMFFFGLFIRLAYYKVIRLSSKLPLMIFWIPVLFFELSYSMENDTLQALNSLLKCASFLWVIYKIAPSLFTGAKKIFKKANENSHHIRDNRSGWSLPG